MHFDYIAVGGRVVNGVSPRVGIQVNETEDEGIHEKCDALGRSKGLEDVRKQGLHWFGLALT